MTKASALSRSKQKASSSRFRWLWLSSLVLASTLIAVAIWSSWRIAPVSDDAYRLSSSLFAACNLQDVTRLESIELQVANVAEDREREHLSEAIQAAREGQWQVAMRQARRLMESRTE